MDSERDEALYVGFPVSAVHPRWYEQEFLPFFRSRSASKVLWITADSSEEVDFLLRRLKASQTILQRSFAEIEAHAEDVGLVWEALFGGLDSDGIVHRCDRDVFLLIYGSARIAERALVRLATPLRILAVAQNITVVGGITYCALEDHPKILEEIEFTAVPVPRFESCSRIDRVLVAKALLEANEGEAQWRYPEGFAEELVDGRPKGRTELELWIRHYKEAGIASVGSVPPSTVPRVDPYPPAPLTKRVLRTRFDALCEQVDELNRKFLWWMGRRLFTPVRYARHPFDGGAADGWFIGCVSYLSCLLFDAADPALRVLSGLVVADDGKLTARSASEFYSNVRALRTRFQHAISYASSHDRSTVAIAQDWFISAVGRHSPDAHEWRVACDALLSEWREEWLKLETCLSMVRDSNARKQIEIDIQAKWRDLPRWRLLDAVSLACERVAPTLFDPELVLQKHLSTLQAGLRASLAPADGLFDEAVRLSVELVAAAAARPPLSAEDLVAAGIPRGPRLGSALEAVKAAYRQDSRLGPKELIDLLASEYEELR